MAFVVVQHLSPDHKSLTVELLSKHTSMRVCRVEDGMAVEPHVVYLLPPKKNLVIQGLAFKLSDRAGGQGIPLPIDIFLASLAETCGEKAVGIILSGTGSDGMRGVREIKPAGGAVLVQDEASAKFDGMPRAAILTGLVDAVRSSPDRTGTCSAVDLPPPRSDALQVFVFGPGTGELIALRVPTGEWLIVDGCATGRILYAPSILDYYAALPQLVVLTHPHQDHYQGLQEVIDRATAGPPDSWPVLGLAVPPETGPRDGTIGDLVGYLKRGGVEQVVSAIVDRWDRAPRCKWNMKPGSTQQLGEATVRAVSPTVPMRNTAQRAHEQSRDFDLNQLSAALSVEWRGHRVVLGSDLVESPGSGSRRRSWSSRRPIARSPSSPTRCAKPSLVCWPPLRPAVRAAGRQIRRPRRPEEPFQCRRTAMRRASAPGAIPAG